MQSPTHHHHAPQDAGYDDHGTRSPSSTTDPSLTEQIESLEQALKLQIQKRIEAVKKMNEVSSLPPTNSTSSPASNQTLNNNDLIRSNVDDLQELIQAFIFEVDGLDGDEAEEQMERKDVLWMLGEISVRVKDVSSAAIVNENEANDKPFSQHKNIQEVPDEVLLQEEINIAMLQGRIVQLIETNQLLMDAQAKSNMGIDPCMNGTTRSFEHHTHAELMQQHRRLQEKHCHMEQRHGNIMKEMQQSLHEKNATIRQLKHETHHSNNDKVDDEIAGKDDPADDIAHADALSPPHLNSPNQGKTPFSPLAIGRHQPGANDEQSKQISMSPLAMSPHKDMQIASLQEDIEERDVVLAELKAELDEYTVKKNVHTMETDRVKIKYLEGIVTDLEKKLNEMERAQMKNGRVKSSTRQSNGDTDCRSDEVISLTNTGKYSGQWDWSLVEKSLAPEAFSSSRMEDMELKIAELMTRLNDSEDEKCILERKLRILKQNDQKETLTK